MNVFVNNKNLLLLLGVLFVGSVLLYPTLDFQPLFSTGDHGRDLYCMKKVFEGKVPYRDFWWQYGPVMLYYFVFLFKIFGMSIQTVLLGKALIALFAGLFFYLTARNYLSTVLALIATLWFLAFYPEFFYTYCHDGGVLFLIFVLYCLSQYQVHSKKHYIFFGLAGVFFLNLVRINIGITCWLSLLAGVGLTDYFKKTSPPLIKQPAMRLGLLLTILLTVLVYFLMAYGLSASALNQCFPYLSSHRYDAINPFQAIRMMTSIVATTFTLNWATLFLGTSLILCALGTAFLLAANKMDAAASRKAKLTLYTVLIFLVLNMHETFFSNFYFRIFWVFPFILLLCFIFFEYGLAKLPKAIKAGFLVFLTLVGLYAAYDKIHVMNLFKVEGNLFQYGPHRLYMANLYGWRQVNRNLPDYAFARPWIQTVTQAADYLKSHVKDDATILVIPYDPLYYFLIDKDSPVYPLAFFNFIGISLTDELEMLGQLEKQNVDYAVLSNRAFANYEPYLGSFGREYCPMLYHYLNKNFSEVATFGEWGKRGAFAWDHGVKIYKRKE